MGGGGGTATRVNEFIHTRRCNTAPWAESNFVSRPRRQNGAANARHEGHLPRLSGIVTAFSDESKFFAGSFPFRISQTPASSLKRQFLPARFSLFLRQSRG